MFGYVWQVLFGSLVVVIIYDDGNVMWCIGGVGYCQCGIDMYELGFLLYVFNVLVVGDGFILL